MLTVVVRVAVLLTVTHAHPERIVAHNSSSYVGPALSLLHDRDYDRSPETSAPEFQRTPGYPAFVAAVYWATDESNTAVVVVQAVLSGMSVLLAVALARRLTGSGSIGLAAGVLVALDPVTNSQIGLLATETLATVLVMLTAYCGVRTAQSSYSPRWSLAMGTSLAAATYVRPTTYFFPIVVVALLGVVALRDRTDRVRIARCAAAFGLPCVVLLGAWSVHNQAEVGSWRFTGLDATNLYWYRAAAVIAERDGTDRQDVQIELTERLGNLAVGRGDPRYDEYRGGAPPPEWEHRQGEYYARAQSEALEILRSEPGITAREVGRSFVGQIVQSGWATSSRFFLGRSPGIVAVGVPVVVAMQALGVFGAVVALRRASTSGRFAHVLSLAMVVHTMLVATLGSDAANGYRMRVPIWPIWCLYTAMGVRELAARRRRGTPATVAATVRASEPAPYVSVTQ